MRFVAFGLGLISGGLAVGAVLWFAGALLAWIPGGILIACAIAIGTLALLKDLGWLEVRLPENARQVPIDVMYRDPRITLVQFGFELGTGARTFVTAAAPYSVAATVVALHPPIGQVAIAGAAFGAGRLCMALMREVSRDADAWDSAFAARSRLVASLASLTALGVLAWLVAYSV